MGFTHLMLHAHLIGDRFEAIGIISHQNRRRMPLALDTGRNAASLVWGLGIGDIQA
jgi:hypothetical protein